MDIFGINSALKTMTQMFFENARRTGRTTQLAKMVKAGDGVLFLKYEDIRFFKSMLRSLNIDPLTIRLEVYADRGVAGIRVNGHMYLDHRLVQHLHEQALDDCGQRIQHIQDSCSGLNPTHVEITDFKFK